MSNDLELIMKHRREIEELQRDHDAQLRKIHFGVVRCSTFAFIVPPTWGLVIWLYTLDKLDFIFLIHAITWTGFFIHAIWDLRKDFKR